MSQDPSDGRVFYADPSPRPDKFAHIYGDGHDLVCGLCRYCPHPYAPTCTKEYAMYDNAKTENPKAASARADAKPPLHLLERPALEACARVMAGGAEKYGLRNYRLTGTIDKSVYASALLRHALAWASGEEHDPDTGESHLAHIEANVHVLAGARDAGTYRDDLAVSPAVHERSLAGDPATNRELNGLNKLSHSVAWPEPYSGRDPDEPSVEKLEHAFNKAERERYFARWDCADGPWPEFWRKFAPGVRLINVGAKRETWTRTESGLYNTATGEFEPNGSGRVVDMSGNPIGKREWIDAPVGTRFINCGSGHAAFRRTFSGITPETPTPQPRSAI